MPKIKENEFISTNDQYGDGIAVDIYKNEYSLVAAKKNSKTGDIWAEWCFPQKYEDGKHVPGEKAIPRKLSLGMKEQAIQRLEQLIMMIEGRGDTKSEQGGSDYEDKDRDSDIPF